jgi:hypothetical protein
LGELVDFVAERRDVLARFAKGVAQLLVLRHRLGQLPLRLEQSFFERPLTLGGIGKAPPELVDLLFEHRDLCLEHRLGCLGILCHDRNLHS